MSFEKFIRELRSTTPEVPLEPELKHDRQQQDRRLREDQDLRAGAVMQAVIEEGQGEGFPCAGDLVYVHVTVRTEDEVVLYSTRSQDGGNGQALAFILEKGQRAPRAWEIALKGMHLQQIMALKVKPSYAYQHPDCSMPAPEGVPRGQPLCFELQLVQWYPAEHVRTLMLHEDSYRRVLQEGTGWESPRPPFDVSFHCKACCPAYDGIQLTGFRYFSTDAGEPVQAQLGSGQLPQGLEAALGSMTLGERSTFVVPAAKMQPGTREVGQDGAAPQAATRACLLPAPPSNAAQVELELELLSLVQVRDMTGDGSVLKRRLKQGNGEFPVDCPVEDTTVRVHYRVRPAQRERAEPKRGVQGGSGAWVFDSRQGTATAEDGAAPSSSTTAAIEFDTGCGEMPEGLEMAVKLMVPGELAHVTCRPSHAYQGREDAPPGIDAAEAVEFEIELISFDREGHWQNLAMADRFNLAERMKGKGNELFRGKRYSYARSRYERLMRLLDSTRDYETQEEVERMDALKLAVLSNLALCCFHQTDYMQSVAYASKALEHEPESAKLLLRRARALSLKGEYQQAEEDLVTCQSLSPEGTLAQEVEQELALNKRRAKAAESKQRQTFKNFFDR